MRIFLVYLLLCIPFIFFGQIDSTLQDGNEIIVADSTVEVKIEKGNFTFFEQNITDLLKHYRGYSFFENENYVLRPNNPLLLSNTENINFKSGLSSLNGSGESSLLNYRGMGQRSLFTASNNLIYINEIPITTNQGYSGIDDLNPTWFPHIEMMQGSVSHPLYLGGTIRLNSSDLLYRPVHYGPTIQLNLGSHGYKQLNTSFSYAKNDTRIFGGYEKTIREGWRENSALNRESIFINGKFFYGDNQELDIFLNVIRGNNEIPSSLNKLNFEKQPAQAAENWHITQAFREYDRVIMGLTFKKYSKFKITPYYSYLTSREANPYNLLNEKRHQGGLRFFYQKEKIYIGKTESELSVFGEYQISNEKLSRFQNLYDSTNHTFNNKGDIQGRSYIIGQRVNFGINMETELLYKASKIPRFNGKNPVLFLVTGLNGMYQYNHIKDDEDYSVPLQMAPLIALSYRPNYYRFVPEIRIYRSYSIPSIEENVLQNMGFDYKLKPEVAWTGEIGIKTIPFEKYSDLKIDLVYYYTRVKNLLTPRAVEPEQFISVNSGRSQHKGLELKLHNFAYTRNYGWHALFLISGYYGHFTYLDFNDSTGSFDGNELPGFPDWHINSSLELIFDKRSRVLPEVNLGIMGRYTSGYFLNDENTIETEPYFLLQSWLTFEKRVAERIKFVLTFGVRNITNSHYASMTVVNNRAFGGEEPRYYYPGEPINWYGSILLNYAF